MSQIKGKKEARSKTWETLTFGRIPELNHDTQGQPDFPDRDFKSNFRTGVVVDRDTETRSPSPTV